MKVLLFFPLLVCFAACKTPKDTTSTEKNLGPKEIKIRKINAQFDDLRESSNETRIKAVRIVGNKLSIDVSYVGNCEAHTFTLLGSKTLTKSFPAVRNIRLLHNGKKERCSELIEETLEVDISSFAELQKEGNTTTLMLEGWDERIEYKFTVPVKTESAPKVDANGQVTE